MELSVTRLGPKDLDLLKGLLDLFGEVFDEPHTYVEKRPTDSYLLELLADDTFIALGAIEGGEVIGGLTAYELRKFEQDRRELFVYDLAVSANHRRQGIATALFTALRGIGREKSAYVIFVQADQGDDPAIALYGSLGRREEVLHFDISIDS